MHYQNNEKTGKLIKFEYNTGKGKHEQTTLSGTLSTDATSDY